MGFYDLSKAERIELVNNINKDIKQDIQHEQSTKLQLYFSNSDTYIRKTAYQAVGRIYLLSKELQTRIIEVLKDLLKSEDFKIRQSVINAAGEIGKTDFAKVQWFFDTGLFDSHHSAKNAVIGSIKKMGEVNPKPVLKWPGLYLHHADKEIRREICHGIELRGRTHPEDILVLLRELQYDNTSRVRKTLVHVLGQIAYKKDCLEKVVEDLKSWENKELVSDALEEIIDVHHRYRNFSYMTQEEARFYIEKNCYTE